jgi:cytoskeletal protein RodZ
MNQSLIIGASVIGGVGLLSLALYKFNQPNYSTSNLSSHSLVEDLGYGSRNSSTDSGYYTAEDEIIGGKTKRKNKRKNKTKKK